MSGDYLRLLACALVLGGCSSGSTSVSVSIRSASPSTIDSLLLAVALPAQQRTLQRAFGSAAAPLTLPQTVVLELPDQAMLVTVTATATATGGGTSSATASVTTVPHRQVSLDLDLPAAWQPVAASGPDPRHSARMVYDSTRDQVLLFGGNGPNGLLNDLERWDGTQWQPIASATSPPGRGGFGLAYDSARHVVVLFGGTTANGPANDTWEWDGTNWTQKMASGSGANQPWAVQATVMAYHAGRQRTVLFGGWSNANQQELADTWEWDGSSWTKQAAGSGPAGDQAGALAYDSARMVIVYVPGASPAGPGIDTWEYDVAGHWTQRTTTVAPAARRAAGLAYDVANAVTVLFGGQDRNGKDLGDTWRWDGTSWTQWMGSGPAGRRSMAMTYDPAHAEVVLFGGSSGHHSSRDGSPTTTLGDTWRF